MKHEEIGAALLLEWGFGEKVSSMVASHVWAKRYLVSCEPYYINRLTAASLKSFQLQGGLMSDDEVAEARKHPCFHQALNLRRWDDTGKRIDLDTEIPESVWADLAECLMVNRSFD
jgi:predicted HD phosphohydrolase